MLSVPLARRIIIRTRVFLTTNLTPCSLHSSTPLLYQKKTDMIAWFAQSSLRYERLDSLFFFMFICCMDIHVLVKLAAICHRHLVKQANRCGAISYYPGAAPLEVDGSLPIEYSNACHRRRRALASNSTPDDASLIISFFLFCSRHTMIDSYFRLRFLFRLDFFFPSNFPCDMVAIFFSLWEGAFLTDSASFFLFQNLIRNKSKNIIFSILLASIMFSVFLVFFLDCFVIFIVFSLSLFLFLFSFIASHFFYFFLSCFLVW
ncbi:unnamed protein product [Acanthosepion pharaonis]|uniref:Uncharacterized protein n=1 Tax=Acanthosepion pharaonis TaxID=158019 RepID=A0A812C956_ACAPH|nr:unnamed protein product [Sepia pharaonis]